MVRSTFKSRLPHHRRFKALHQQLRSRRAPGYVRDQIEGEKIGRRLCDEMIEERTKEVAAFRALTVDFR